MICTAVFGILLLSLPHAIVSEIGLTPDAICCSEHAKKLDCCHGIYPLHWSTKKDQTKRNHHWTSRKPTLAPTTLDCSDNCTAAYASSIMNRTTWTETSTANYLKEFQLTDMGKCILSMNTSAGETRPDPKCYLPQTALDFHFSPYRTSGAGMIVSTYWASLTKFANLSNQWVSTYQMQIELLSQCKLETNPSDCILNGLGMTASEFDMFHYDQGTGINRVILVYVPGDVVDDLDIRIPSGNEDGVDDNYWHPGGYTSGGLSEAIVDIIHKGQYCWYAITDVNGTFCYPECEIVCNDVDGCEETQCDHDGDEHHPRRGQHKHALNYEHRQYQRKRQMFRGRNYYQRHQSKR
eukprot:303441_1